MAGEGNEYVEPALAKEECRQEKLVDPGTAKGAFCLQQHSHHKTMNIKQNGVICMVCASESRAASPQNKE